MGNTWKNMALWCFLLPLRSLSRELTLKLTLPEACSAKDTPLRTTLAHSGDGQIPDDLVSCGTFTIAPSGCSSLSEVAEHPLGAGHTTVGTRQLWARARP